MFYCLTTIKLIIELASNREATMEEEFWQYSKNIYAKSSKSFLWLQDERSLDVNLLLFCYWLGEKGKRLTVDDISRCCKNV